MAEATLIVILGPRGSGKSTLLRRIVGGRARRLTLDPLGEHDTLGDLVEIDEAADLVLRKRTGPLALRVVATSEDDGADTASVSLALRRGVFAVDEADRWLSSEPAEPWVEHVERGRHYGVGLVLATRRPYRLWRAATANADWLYVFRSREPRDLAYLREYAGPGAVQQLEQLPPYHYVRVHCATGDVAVDIVGGRGTPGARSGLRSSAPAPEELPERSVREVTQREQVDPVDGGGGGSGSAPGGLAPAPHQDELTGHGEGRDGAGEEGRAQL